MNASHYSLNKNGAFEYDINILCAYISYQTDTPLHYIKRKAQITYLSNYLNYFKVKNVSIFFVYENEYIDLHYLEDYSAYYLRCFQKYKKNCCRIHFFKSDKVIKNYDDELRLALSNDESSINQENYLGFIVIRPIPQTFLAKACLKPYYQNKNDILKNYNVSLFGIKLTVKSIAFQEQDKILSACATSSLWSFFHAHPNTNIPQLPSPSKITKNAYPEENRYREFPNSGLSTDMICRSLKRHDLEPHYFEFPRENLDTNIDLLKELIYSYSSSGLPLILGVSVKQDKNPETEALPRHAVTILDFSLKEGNKDYSSNNEPKFSLVSHHIDKLYVHDDRLGPFAKIEFKDDILEVKLAQNPDVTKIEVFSNEIYIPDTLIIGVNHKLRISYIEIRDTCEDLMFKLTSYLVDHNADKKYIDVLESFNWDIRIKNNNDLKESILKSDIDNKESYLLSSWPKYIWSAKASLDNIDIIEFLFDATDIGRGSLFLEMLLHKSKPAKAFIEYLKMYCSDKLYNIRFKDGHERWSAAHSWGLFEYFSTQNSYLENLDDLFGIEKMPKTITANEIEFDAVIDQCHIRLGKECDSEYFHFDTNLPKGSKYIWVVDSHGFLCIGTEKEDQPKGHPTLTNGMPARIGGEINYNIENKVWVINPFSGRYSCDFSFEQKIKLLDNVLKYKFRVFFPNENFSIDYGDATYTK